jgi:hypothetical protein
MSSRFGDTKKIPDLEVEERTEAMMGRWIRKSDLDARIGRDTPAPTEVISNWVRR